MSIFQLNIFTHKDIFQHIFFHFCYENIRELSENYSKSFSVLGMTKSSLISWQLKLISEITKVCKKVEITYETWRCFFSRANFQLPGFLPAKSETWIHFAVMEFAVQKRVDRCLDSMKHFYSIENTTGIDIDSNENKIFFVEGPMDHHLTFDLKNFNPKNLIFLFDNQEVYEELLIKWNNYILERKSNNGEDYTLSTPQLEIQITKGDDTTGFEFLCEFSIHNWIGYEASYIEYAFTESNVRKIFEVLLRDGFHPENGDIKLIF
jgi:hypothetical protein